MTCHAYHQKYAAHISKEKVGERKKKKDGVSLREDSQTTRLEHLNPHPRGQSQDPKIHNMIITYDAAWKHVVDNVPKVPATYTPVSSEVLRCTY